MDLLFRVLAAQGIKGRLVGALLVAVCGKLRRTARSLTILAARAAAGTLPAARPPRPRQPAARSAPATPPSPQPPARPRLPGSFGWLPRQIEGEAIQSVAAAKSQLACLLDAPDMVALIAAAPQAGRLLRPICRMLGLRPPPHLALPPRPPRPPRPRRPRRQQAARPAPARDRSLIEWATAVLPLLPRLAGAGSGPPRRAARRRTPTG